MDERHEPVVNRTIDLNCDLGEGLGNEPAIMPLLSSCNIACGGHAGSLDTMDEVIALALRHDVKIGAHPSFPDRANFGRVALDMGPDEVQHSVEDQLRLFMQRAVIQNAPVHHVKAHGALYNLAAADEGLARAVVQAVRIVHARARIYVPSGSLIERVARAAGVDVVHEAFADRAYNTDGTLVARSHPHALITEPDAVVAHVKRMCTTGMVRPVQGGDFALRAQTFCVHGDNPGAREILERMHREFTIA